MYYNSTYKFYVKTHSFPYAAKKVLSPFFKMATKGQVCRPHKREVKLLKTPDTCTNNKIAYSKKMQSAYVI